MTETSEQASRRVYQLKVTLKEIRPPIWRRILVPSHVTLHELHDILQIAMGWTDYHLHGFRVGEAEYGVPDPEEDDIFGAEMIDDTQVKLSQVVREKDNFFYDYDYGDGWEHEILVEKILVSDQDTQCPACVAGKRACPPEDCGGPWGYSDFLAAIQDPGHPDHDQMLEWIGGKFDPEDFNLDAVNEQLCSS